MVQGKGDANHGAAHPPPHRDGFSKPAEGPWGNPTHQDGMASLIGKDEGISPAASKGLDTSWQAQEQATSSTLMSAGKGTQQALQPNLTRSPAASTPWELGPRGLWAPSVTSQHQSSGPGLRHTGMNWWKGRTMGLNHPHCGTGNSSSQYTTKVSLQLPKGEMERDQGTKSSQGHISITTAAAPPSPCITGTGGKNAVL